MKVDEVLTVAYEDLAAALHSPIMVVALRGWFDVAEVATGALRTVDAQPARRGRRVDRP